jgi:hypothetical protein
LGRRVEKEVIAGTTTVSKYVYDNEDILLELNGANAIVARYTHGPGIDEPLITEKNSWPLTAGVDPLIVNSLPTTNLFLISRRLLFEDLRT